MLNIPIKVGELDYILQDFNMVKIESRPQTRGQRLDIVYSLGSENYSGKKIP